MEVFQKFENNQIEFPNIFIIDIKTHSYTGFEQIERLVKFNEKNIQYTSLRKKDLDLVIESPFIDSFFEKYILENDFSQKILKL
jgi:hypothetical protein